MHSFRRHHLTRAAVALSIVGLGVAAAPASAAAAPRVLDIDAELERGQLRLSTETTGATKVTFRFAGRSAVGRLTEVDREDGTRDYERSVKAGKVRAGRHTITVRACGASGCTTKSERIFVELDD